MAKESAQRSRIESITVRVTTSDGSSHEIQVDPSENDSIFWSLEALDKFALPFYLATRGFQEAAGLRAQAEEELARSGLVFGPHKKLCSILPVRFDKRDASPIRV